MKNIVRSISRSLMRGILSVAHVGQENVSVISGPMRGVLLPRERALMNLSQVLGIYERDFGREFLQTIKEGDVVFDVGANYGYFSLLASTVDGVQIVAFEPDPKLYDEADSIVRNNDLQKRIFLEKTALSDSEGIATLVRSGSDATGVLTNALQGQPVDASSEIEVTCKTLDGFLRNSDWSPDILKIDVEGAEAHVVRGGQQFLTRKRPALFIEVHGLTPAKALWAALDEFDYQCHQIIRQGGVVPLHNEKEFLDQFSMDRWKIVHLKATRRR